MKIKIELRINVLVILCWKIWSLYLVELIPGHKNSAVQSFLCICTVLVFTYDDDKGGWGGVAVSLGTQWQKQVGEDGDEVETSVAKLAYTSVLYALAKLVYTSVLYTVAKLVYMSVLYAPAKLVYTSVFLCSGETGLHVCSVCFGYTGLHVCLIWQKNFAGLR